MKAPTKQDDTHTNSSKTTKASQSNSQLARACYYNCTPTPIANRFKDDDADKFYASAEIRSLDRPVQVDGIKTRVGGIYGFRA
jgi:hypothetical protein